jgi:hypothetical protein
LTVMSFVSVDVAGPLKVNPFSPVSAAWECYPAELKCTVFFEELKIARIFRNSSAFYGTLRLTYVYTLLSPDPCPKADECSLRLPILFIFHCPL